MYTATSPKKARKVTLSNVAGDSVQVSWTTPKEHMYSCFEVFMLHQKMEIINQQV